MVEQPPILADQRRNKSRRKNSQKDNAPRRARSEVAFPYNGLSDAIAIVKTVDDLSEGQGTADLEGVAHEMKHTGAAQPAFRLRLSAARMFGLVTYEAQEVHLTPLGVEVAEAASPEVRERALIQAFTRVPLYAGLFEKYGGARLPPDRDIEADMLAMGVPEKQRSRARQAFRRSALTARLLDETTGLFDAPSDMPDLRSHTVRGDQSTIENEQSLDTETRDDGGPSNDASVSDTVEAPVAQQGQPKSLKAHPLITALIESLPPYEGDGAYALDDSAYGWLTKGFEANLHIIYGGLPPKQQTPPYSAPEHTVLTRESDTPF
jgi:hypothetical protein